MKKLFGGLLGLTLVPAGLLAAPLFSDDFNGYTTGVNLVGQGPWLQTGSTATSPLQVSATNTVAIGKTGQDAYAAFSGGAVTLSDGTSIYVGATINLSAAQSGGDYFLHLTATVGNSSVFPDRFFAKSSGAGFVLGWSEDSTTPLYGTTVLSFGTSYRVVFAYNDVAGTVNDTGTIYVNPTDVSIAANNTPYLTKSYTSTFAESEAFAAANIRQGSSSSAPTLALDDLNVSETFSDTAVFTPVPEPQSLALIGLFGVLVAGAFRRAGRNK